MNINEAFPSNYIKALDLKGGVARVKIQNVVYETVGSDQKLVMYFENKEKGLILNKTNGMAIAAEFGPETDGWIGATIELFSMKVPFNGQQVDSIRIRIPRQTPARATVTPNARARAEMATAGAEPNPPAGGGYDDLDDEIPF